MKNNTTHYDHPPAESVEKTAKCSTGSGAKKLRKEEKDGIKRTSKELIEDLHTAIAKEAEASMENLIVVSIVRVPPNNSTLGRNMPSVE